MLSFPNTFFQIPAPFHFLFQKGLYHGSGLIIAPRILKTEETVGFLHKIICMPQLRTEVLEIHLA